MKSKLQFILSFIFLATAGFIAQSIHAQGIGDRNRPAGRGTYKIVGTVYLPDGRPAQDVSVSVSGAETSGASSRTDIDGAYVLSGLSSGNYTVSVRASGYQTETEFLTIAEGTISGQSFQIPFHLRPPGQPKQDARSENPNPRGVPKASVAKYEKALEFLAKGDAKSAMPLLDEAIAAYPNFSAAYYEKGAALLKLNDLDKAVEAFVKAITIKPDYLEAKYGYGMAVFQKKNYEVAEAVFRDVLKQKNDTAEAHMYLGMSLFYLKNGLEAETELKAAIAGKGGEKLPLAHLYLGQIYIMKKQNAAAAAELQKYVDLAPKAPNIEKVKATIADLKKQS